MAVGEPVVAADSVVVLVVVVISVVDVDVAPVGKGNGQKESMAHGGRREKNENTRGSTAFA